MTSSAVLKHYHLKHDKSTTNIFVHSHHLHYLSHGSRNIANYILHTNFPRALWFHLHGIVELHYFVISMEAEQNDKSNNENLHHDCSRDITSCIYRLVFQSDALIRNTLNRGRIETLGPKHLQIFKVTLPFDATSIFQKIIDSFNLYDARREQDRGKYPKSVTSLYSLTKHDVAVVDLPGNILDLVQEMQAYIAALIHHLYFIPFFQRIHMDRHQPHVLKYDASNQQNFRSVPLHHDSCHGTLKISPVHGCTCWNVHSNT